MAAPDLSSLGASTTPPSEPLLRFCAWSRSISPASHMLELFFAEGFILGFRLTKVSVRGGSGGFLRLRRLTSARKEATEKTHNGHGC